MLSQPTIDTVKSTAPLLADEGERITRLFYDKLFDHHPELKHIFNMANQAKGEQARALADSVFAYATHIDQLEALGPAVKRIAHKHASLQVAPEHYPIVGKYLLEAIRDHLKLHDDDPVLTAWAEAYEALAAIFIQAEEGIYQANEATPGGWRGDRVFIIDRAERETDDVKSFYLRPEDNKPIAEFRPGQYIGVKTQPPSSAYDEIRQYSLSSAPGEPYYRITVKAEGVGTSVPGHVSNYLHDASVGDRVWLRPPTGDFVVEKRSERPVLIGGGIGITPLISMLLNAVKQAWDLEHLVLIHCCRDRSHHVMHDELLALSAQKGFQYYVAYEQGEGADHIGYLDTAILERWLPFEGRGDVYFCGPTPFMSGLNILLKRMGYGDDQLHYEIFGPRIRFSGAS
ncbi:NO-inducible flavohemoprotein [Halomonas sp. HK25]|uniref:NO-inducible flavohemoprotein n=1 Tax=Halomonas sp. HK25 TaxID=3394321 RepID=UPI0039FCF48F